jgi:arylsulfatase A-like enzyme
VVTSVLKTAGYNTMQTGNWHLGEEDYSMPTAHGFDDRIRKPLYIQADFLFRRWKQMVEEDPAKSQEQPWKAVAPAELMQIYAAEDARRGRNEPCTCASGRKWKHCHGQAGTDPTTRHPLLGR